MTTETKRKDWVGKFLATFNPALRRELRSSVDWRKAAKNINPSRYTPKWGLFQQKAESSLRSELSKLDWKTKTKKTTAASNNLGQIQIDL